LPCPGDPPSGRQRAIPLNRRRRADDDCGVRVQVGPTPNRRLWRVCAGALVVALALAAAGCKLRSVDGKTYIAQNNAALRDVPVFPGARFIGTSSVGDRHGNGWPAEDDPPSGGPYMRFRTERTYQLPAAVRPDEVLRFYEVALRGHWLLDGYDGGGRYFRKGSAHLDVSVAGGILYVTVDHHFF
jgi:hypothetical protein